MKTKECITIKDVENVKIGDVLNFRSPTNNNKIIRRKVHCFSIDSLNGDNVHVRIEFKAGNTIYSPVVENVISLNPHIKQVKKQVSMNIQKTTGFYNGFETDIFAWFIEYKGDKSRYGRPFIYITNTENKLTEWYL
ncbi:hypothetical protein [Petrimonas sulfuriphila]|uniref:hypothetical protein n=1 Tax=Petrimonas sulfuriphila TaxID=285070 RepID=UPI003EB70CF6